MTPETFLKEFGTLAETEGAVGQLREVAFELAVSGQMGTGSSSDPDAGSLTRTREAKRAQLAERLGLRATEPVAPNGARVPPRWTATTLDQLGLFLGGGTPSKDNPRFWNGNVPWVTPKDMKRALIDDSIDRITEDAVVGSSVRWIPEASLLMVVRGMILAHSFPVAVTTRQVTVNQDMKALVPADPAWAPFLLVALQAARRRVLRQVARSSHGTCRLDSEVLRALEIGLPPLPEQKRIVEKVDQLMALCDELEEQQQKKRATSVTLNKAALSAVVTATDKPTLKSTWKRVQDHFEVLYDLPENVGQLRLAIMDLASLGRLVSQLPGDVSLDGTVRGKREEIRTATGKAPVTADPALVPPSLPGGWVLEKIENLGQDPNNPVQTGPFGAQLHKSEFVKEGVPVIAVGNLTGTGFTEDGLYFITKRKALQLRRYDIQAGDLLFARSGATTGKVCVAPSFIADWRMTGHILRVRLDQRLVLPELLVYWLWGSRFVQEQVAGGMRGGTRPGYNTGLLKRIVVPLPPVAEQKRIVAKVVQLMALCDDLEAKLKKSREDGQRLMQAVVEGLVA